MPQLLDVSLPGGRVCFLLRHTTFGEFRQQTRTVSPAGHFHDVFHIVLFVGGENCFSLGGQVTPCKPGTLVITAPKKEHDFGPIRPGNVVYHELTFSLTDAGGLELDMSLGEYLGALFGLGSPVETPDVYYCTPAGLNTLQEHFRVECQASVKPGVDNISACYRGIFRLLECITEMFFTEISVNVNEKHKLETAREYISCNYSQNLSLDEMSQKANLSRYHFCRAFRKEFGVSPKSYQIELRLQAAARLLETSGLSCGEISDKLGFSDQYFFSKSFKKRFGVSPKFYCKN